MRIKFVILGFLLSLLLTGCFSSSYYAPESSVAYDGVAMNSSKSTAYVTGLDRSITYIDSDSVDYSYTFSANGYTRKTKSEMLEDFEHIQDFVVAQGGFIENVTNNYDIYVDRDYYDSTSTKLSANGYLSFTIEIDKDKTEDVLSRLEQLCRENDFTVTQFTQRIQNFENYKVVDEYSDEVYYGETITADELERRTKYADISVYLSYRVKRPLIIRIALTIKQTIISIFDNFDEILQVCLMVTIVGFVIFILSIVFYKAFRKMMWKHYCKHPELYFSRDISVTIKDCEINDMKGKIDETLT